MASWLWLVWPFGGKAYTFIAHLELLKTITHL